MSRLNEIEFRLASEGKSQHPHAQFIAEVLLTEYGEFLRLRAQQALNPDADGAQVVDRARTKSDGCISKSEDATNTSYKEGEFS